MPDTSLILQLIAPLRWNWMGSLAGVWIQRLPLGYGLVYLIYLWRQPLKAWFEEQGVILTATSGDTGKAAMAWVYRCAWRAEIIVPSKDGVQQGTRAQMTLRLVTNTHVIAIDGNTTMRKPHVQRCSSSLVLTANKLQFHQLTLWTLVFGTLELFIMFMPTLELVKSGGVTGGSTSGTNWKPLSWHASMPSKWSASWQVICASNDNQCFNLTSLKKHVFTRQETWFKAGTT